MHQYDEPEGPTRQTMHASRADAHILIPKWFFGFLSAVATLMAIAVVPWAAGITETLTTLSLDMAGLRARFDGRDALQEEVIRGLNQRMTRIEEQLLRLERSPCPCRDATP